MASQLDLIQNLKRLALFADLPESELAHIAETYGAADFSEGDWVIRRGEQGGTCYVIVEGEAGVLIDDEEIGTIGRGSVFGEISILLDEPATADVIARTPLHCLAIPADRLHDFLVEHPEVMYRVLRSEARRLRTASTSRT